MLTEQWRETYPYAANLIFDVHDFLSEMKIQMEPYLADYNNTRNFYYFLDATQETLGREDVVKKINQLPLPKIDLLYESETSVKNELRLLWNRYNKDLPYFCVFAMSSLRNFSVELTTMSFST